MPTPWRRRVWDRHARETARSLDEHWQGWSVMYGPASRRFFAIATWPVCEPLILAARTADELARLMYQTEMIYGARGEIPTWSRGPQDDRHVQSWSSRLSNVTAEYRTDLAPQVPCAAAGCRKTRGPLRPSGVG